jgi:cytochrome c
MAQKLLLIAALILTTTLPLRAQDTPPGTGGDATKGQELWESRCTGCHSLDQNRVGPKHRGVFGRTAGTAEGFSYSPAVKDSGVVWDETTLDTWLTNPQAFIPGARMAFRVSTAEDRAHIIAYLKSLTPPSAPAQN